VSAGVRTSVCVDCATPIIGAQLRCPACQADHAAEAPKMSASAVAEAPLQTPERTGSLFKRIFLVWLPLFVEVLVLAGCGFLLLVKGCAS
jgi:hypothetical protein